MQRRPAASAAAAAGRVRSASVTGAPSARASGTSIDSSMCWTMCTLSSVVSYAASPDEVAKQNDAHPDDDEGDRAAHRPAVARGGAATTTPSR